MPTIITPTVTTQASVVSAKLSFLSQHSQYSSLVPLYPQKVAPKPPRGQSTIISARFSSSSSSLSGNAKADASGESSSTATNGFPQIRRYAADWKAARAYYERGSIYDGRIEGFNGGGLLVRFYSLVGFLPFPQLSPSHSCKEPQKSIRDIAKGLMGSLISVKVKKLVKLPGRIIEGLLIISAKRKYRVIQAEEENRKLILSEKEAAWSKSSDRVNVGDIFAGRVGSVEDYGAFVHLCFPDGLYHLTGLVHVSEVSWDFVQDVRDILSEGDEVRVKVINIDRPKSRLTLSIKQLEEDPLLETLDKVIPQDSSLGPNSLSINNSSTIVPLPGLEIIFEELLLEDGIEDIRINKQGFEKRVVSQDLQLWLSNKPPSDRTFTLLARAGRQVQEIQLTTPLDQEGIKRTLQRVLERVP